MEERRTERLVVVGNGMVSHRFLELVAARAARNAGACFEVTVVGEEPRLAYDRVGLPTFFEGGPPGGRRRGGHRRRPLGPRGGLRAPEAGDEGARDRVRAAAHGAAAR